MCICEHQRVEFLCSSGFGCETASKDSFCSEETWTNRSDEANVRLTRHRLIHSAEDKVKYYMSFNIAESPILVFKATTHRNVSMKVSADKIVANSQLMRRAVTQNAANEAGF